MPENGDQTSMPVVKTEQPGGGSGGGFSPHSTTTTPPQTTSGSVSDSTRKKKVKATEEEEDGHGSSSPTPTEEENPPEADQAEETDTGPLKQCLAAAVRLSGTISRAHGERMLQIIADLLMGTIETGEFQRRVQEVIRVPFRPLVPSLLDKQVPSLRKEIAGQLMLARQNNNNNGQSPQPQQQQQTTEQVKSLLLDDRPSAVRQQHPSLEETTDSSALSIWQVFQAGHSSGTSEAGNSTRKRRASASMVENSGNIRAGGDGVGGCTTVERGESTPKRPNMEAVRKNLLSVSSSSVWTPPKAAQQQPQQLHVQQPPPPSTVTMAVSPPFRQGDEEWANIHTMLNCILSMVEKTRRALGILQQRTTNDPSAGEMASLHQYSHWHVQQQQLKPAHPRREANSHQTHHQHQQQQAYDASELRRQAGELIAQTLKATEDRVSQVKRKAEEAVHDVRRAAMAELQRALSAERLRAERLAAEARRQGAEETLLALGRHSQAKEVCWNCARRANETCSGCNIARYCSTFCQHKHWEVHHKICSRVSQIMLAAAAGGATTTAAAVMASGSALMVDRDLHGSNVHAPATSPTDLRNASPPKPTSPNYIH